MLKACSGRSAPGESESRQHRDGATGRTWEGAVGDKMESPHPQSASRAKATLSKTFERNRRGGDETTCGQLSRSNTFARAVLLLGCILLDSAAIFTVTTRPSQHRRAATPRRRVLISRRRWGGEMSTMEDLEMLAVGGSSHLTPKRRTQELTTAPLRL